MRKILDTTKDAGWQREHMSQNRQAILPNITHYEMGLAPQLIDTALPFLNGQGRARRWDEQVSAKQTKWAHCETGSGPVLT